MNKQTLVLIVIAFLAGFGAGYAARSEKNDVDRMSSIPSASSDEMQLPEGHPPIDGGSGSMGASGHADAQVSEAESKAIVGMQNVQAGRYARAVPLLAAAAEEITAPALRIFMAIAAEGAGETAKARACLKGDSDVEMLRSIGKEAFMQHQDFNIAGPAYQLYLKIRPQDPNRAMMENCVKVWKEQPRR